jgi:hypothetical protein
MSAQGKHLAWSNARADALTARFLETDEVGTALQLLRTGRTVYLLQPPYASTPHLTTAMPCGRSRAYKLGRAVDGVLPTRRELADDLAHGRAQLAREARR